MARGKFGKAALLMGAAAVAAGVLLKRDKVQALLNPGAGQGTSGTSSAPAPAAAPAPAPANYDAPGPPANTATPVPAPDAQILDEDGSVDEAAEEAAAAAEAANIGGQVSDYAGIQDPDEPASEAERPLVEAGEGSSEGEEQAEAELIEAASPADGMSDFERQIDDAIEEQSSPTSGETLEPIRGVDDPPGDAELRAAEEAAAADMARDSEPAPEPPASEAPTQAYSVPPAEDAPGDAPAPPQPSDTAAEAEEPSAYETYITPAVSPPAAEPEEPAGEVPFGEGTTAEQPPETPGTPPTTSWQPPSPEPEESSDPTPPTQEQPQLPTEDKDDDWRTWSGRAIDS